MIRLIALWSAFVAGLILSIVLREERLASQGRVPLGRLRRLWMRGKERRRAPRYRVNWPVHVQRAINVPPKKAARTRDLSYTGAALIVDALFEIGSQIQLEVALPSHPAPLTTIALVIWCKEMPKSNREGRRIFYMGVQFTDLDPADQSKIGKMLPPGQ